MLSGPQQQCAERDIKNQKQGDKQTRWRINALDNEIKSNRNKIGRMKYEGAEIITSTAAGDSEGPRLDVGVK